MVLRKLMLTTVAAVLLGQTAMAGGVVETTDDTVVIATETSSSKAGIIVPLLLLLLIAAAVAGNGDDNTPDGMQASDRRIKTDVVWVGMAQGLPVYQYRYIGSATRFEGVMAQDVLAKMPEAVMTHPNGVMAVNYAKLGMKMKVLH